MHTHTFKIDLPINKVDSDKRLVTGVVLEPDTVDSQGDIVSAEVIEEAAHNFLSRYNQQTQLGIMHSVFGKLGIELVESYIAPVDFALNGVDVKKGTWIITTKILDDALWEKVKKGEITGYSVGGTATVAA